MPQRFKATENAIEKGLENATPKSAIGLIESWETELQGAEFTGSKGLIGDLGKRDARLLQQRHQSRGRANAITVLEETGECGIERDGNVLRCLCIHRATACRLRGCGRRSLVVP